MSKRFINPTQKGTELFPDTTRLPIKLVIPGTEHDPALRQQVMAAYSGRLASFQRKQTQLASLSPGTWYQQREVTPDVKMTYTNNLGQETLRLEIHPSKLTHRVGDQWDWALIEVAMFGGSYYVVLEGLAVMHLPRGDKIYAGTALPIRGAGVSGILPASTAAGERVLFAAPYGPSSPEAADVQYVSYYVDLRGHRGLPLASVDMFAAIGITPENIPTRIEYYAADPGSDGAYLKGTDPHPVRTAFGSWPPTTLNDMIIWPFGGAEALYGPFPPTYFDTISHIWKFAANYDSATYGAGVQAFFTEDRYTNDTIFYPWVVYGVASNPNDYVPAGPTTAVVEVRARVFKGVPSVTSVTVPALTGSPTAKWVLDKSTAPGLSLVGRRTVSVDRGGTLAERMGFTPLGRLDIDLRTGGVSLGPST